MTVTRSERTAEPAVEPAAVSRRAARAAVPPRRGGEYRRAWSLLMDHRGPRAPFVLALVLLVLEALTAVVEPLPIAYVVDFLKGDKPSLRQQGMPTLFGTERIETIVLLGLAIIAIAAVNSAADSLAEVALARGGRVLGYKLRVAMYAGLQRLSLAYHDRRRTGDVLTRVTGDVLVVEEFVVGSLSNLVASLLLLTGTFAVLAYKSASVALVAVVIVPVLAVVSELFSRRIKKESKRQRSREGELASTATEMLSSIRLVQSYGRGSVDLRKFSQQSDQSMRAALGVATVQAQFSFVIALLEALTIASTIWLGVWLVDGSAITVGTLLLFVLLIQNMFKPARKIVSEWNKVGKLLASAERIAELLDRQPAVVDSPHARPAPPLKGRLTFDGVSFSYHSETEEGLPGGQRPVLSDVSFDVEPGEVVALVGPSGAGKSTVAQLVPRLYDPDVGAVRVDGVDLRELTLESLRRQVSLVLQDTALLSGSVAENIAYGIDGATPDDVVAAARLANAHEFIESLPDGYATMLGERGATLSGGQRQRIAIARAFIRRAPVLILDEPTTGLDTGSTALVVEALRSLMQHTTTVVISHDPALVRCADRILVLDDGQVRQQGSHASLLAAGGLYAELFGSHQLHAVPAPTTSVRVPPPPGRGRHRRPSPYDG
ncbi:MAG: ABC transporter ATP-binding protein [Actinomycetes bacterium]